MELAERAAEAASAAGETQFAIALAQQAVELAEPERAGRQHARLARLLWDAGRGLEALPLSARAVELMPLTARPSGRELLESHARLLLLDRAGGGGARRSRRRSRSRARSARATSRPRRWPPG